MFISVPQLSPGRSSERCWDRVTTWVPSPGGPSAQGWQGGTGWEIRGDAEQRRGSSGQAFCFVKQNNTTGKTQANRPKEMVPQGTGGPTQLPRQ